MKKDLPAKERKSPGKEKGNLLAKKAHLPANERRSFS
jgi:hypothetical protein